MPLRETPGFGALAKSPQSIGQEFVIVS